MFMFTIHHSPFTIKTAAHCVFVRSHDHMTTVSYATRENAQCVYADVCKAASHAEASGRDVVWTDVPTTFLPRHDAGKGGQQLTASSAQDPTARG